MTTFDVRQAAAGTISDEDVVARVLAGDTAFFEILMRRYNQRLYRVVRGIIRDASEAEDVVQEAYVNAYVHLDQFAERAKFSTWLTRIAINEALARVRRAVRLTPLDLGTDGDEMKSTVKATDPDPERQAASSELRRTLESAIDELPANYRVVLVLRDIEEQSTLETAACLDLTEDAVKVRLHRARATLREALLHRIGDATPDAYRFDGARCDRIVANVMERINGIADR
jgi:RNA polymerase sigma-70 factor (ECF subfamily)